MTSIDDHFRFFSLWLRQPFRIGAVAPSGKALATLITDSIDPSDGPVVELGAGTGAFTHALLARGVREQDLVLVESNLELAHLLRQRFRSAHVVAADAEQIGDHYPFGDTAVGAVVSGLPLLTMSEQSVVNILSVTFALLGERGTFYQFTYGCRCPIPPRVLAEVGLSSEQIGWVAMNLPPASVYRFRLIHECRSRWVECRSSVNSTANR